MDEESIELTDDAFVMDSILDSVKKLVGISYDYTEFDADIIMAINTAMFTLWQLGVGLNTSTPFKIEDRNAKWSDFVEEGRAEMCKSYVGLRTRMIFDPPTSGILSGTLKDQIQEFEWRLATAMDECNVRDGDSI